MKKYRKNNQTDKNDYEQITSENYYNGTTEPIKTESRVRQGDALTSTLSNIKLEGTIKVTEIKKKNIKLRVSKR